MITKPLPEGAITVKCTELRDGDRIVGAKYPSSVDWTSWTKSIIKGEVIDDRDEMNLPLYYEDENKIIRSCYSKRLEFLVLRHPQKVGPTKTISDYPHRCTRCGGPAYINLFNHVDCQKNCQ